MGINEVVQIGSRIKEYRKSKGITQKELALRADIPYSTYSNYENNNREPNREQLQKIATALDVPLYELMGFDGSIRVKVNHEQMEAEEAAKSAHKAFLIENGQRVEVDKPVKFTTSSRSHVQTEAYELFHSLLSEEWVMSQEQETIAVQLKDILGAYNSLNDAGRKEAVKRVEELTELPRYTKPDEPPQE